MGSYNQIAGRGLERIAALSDGVFAFAMTVMVLEIHVPAAAGIHSELDLWRALIALGPRALTYVMSFLTLGIFWVGQQTQLNHFTHTDRDLSWLHLAFLAAVTMTPFSTDLLAEFIGFRVALLAYWLNLVLLGVLLLISWRYARRAGLYSEAVTPHLDEAVVRRIVRAQSFYALGAALCVLSPYWSIGFIVLVQLNYAIAPKIPWLAKVLG
jgi:uncharacterized membrane protein